MALRRDVVSTTMINLQPPQHRDKIDPHGLSPRTSALTTSNSGTGPMVNTSAGGLPVPGQTSGKSPVARIANKFPSLSVSPKSRAKQGTFKGTRGLRNLGNTCFMNSCIQCLSNLQPLTDYFLADAHLRELNKERGALNGDLARAYGDLLQQLWSESDKVKSAVKPSNLKKLIGECCSLFQGYEQQDSQEFLRFFLDALHEDLNRITIKVPYTEIKDIPKEQLADKGIRWWSHYEERNKSQIKDLFCGQLLSIVHCSECENESTTFDPFWDVSVPIPDHPDAGFTVQNCFDRFTTREHLTGTDAVFCSHCKKHTDSTKEIKLQRVPPILVVHLKRFQQLGIRNTKITAPIRLSESRYLDIGPYCTPEVVLHQAPSTKSYHDPLPNSPRSYVDDTQIKSNKKSIDGDLNTEYSLIGVVNHMGSVSGGHYTASARHSANDSWYQFNDANVSEISIEQLCPKSAYVLFYSRV